MSAFLAAILLDPTLLLGEAILTGELQTGCSVYLGEYLEDHPRTCKWLVTPIYKQFRPFGRGRTPVRGLSWEPEGDTPIVFHRG